MNRIAKARQGLTSDGGRIGSGRLVLVVGPSGAGKDTLIARVRGLCHDDPSIVFPLRIVTRPASSAEAHDTLSATEFEQVLAAGGFALWWRAHGLSYALPRSVDSDICAGRTVVCNVSRTMIAPARDCYARVSAVLITAPAESLAARLVQRGRETADSIADRLRRSGTLDGDLRADFVVQNVGPPEFAAEQLMDIICGHTFGSRADMSC